MGLGFKNKYERLCYLLGKPLPKEPAFREVDGGWVRKRGVLIFLSKVNS